MILLDWTRMGRSYCLAGAVWEGGTWRIVRPLLWKNRDAPVRNVGWSAYLLDGHHRWEVFEVIAPVPAPAQPPHVEDTWVRTLLPRRQLAPPTQRQAILSATLARPEEPFFGTPFEPLRAVGLRSGTGLCSLTTVVVPREDITFSGSHLRGPEPDIRVTLKLPGLGARCIPVKDHHLLLRAETTATTLDGRLQVLEQLVQQMGARVAVRLGLSRCFQADARGPGLCWLMADGFFSFVDPQP